MKRTIVILQARTSSTRLPGKVMMEINDEPMIYWQAKRILSAKRIDKLIIATSSDSTDNELANYLLRKGFLVYRGSLDNVLSRFLEVSAMHQHDAIVRLTGDCPLVMPELLDAMISKFYEEEIDYLSNIIPPTYPDGLDIEIVRCGVLERLIRFNLSSEEIEHVTMGIYNRPESFKLSNFKNLSDNSNQRWTVDYQSDFDFVSRIFHEFRNRESEFTLKELIDFLAKTDKTTEIKGTITRKSSIPTDNNG